MEIKTTHFLVALVAATAIHLVLFPLISETKPPPKKPPTEVVLIDLAALGEPDAPEAPPAAAQEPLPAPEAAPAVQAPLPEPEVQPKPEVQPEPTPAPEPEPVTQPEPEPEPVIAPEPEPEPVAQPEPELEPEPAPPPRPLPKPVPKPTPPKPEPPKPQPAPPPPAPQQPAPPRPAPPRPAVEQSRPAPPTVERPRLRKGIKTGVPQGTAKAAKTALNRYITEIYHLIEAKKVYPSRSLRRREQGTVIVRLTLAADGSLIKVAAAAGGPKRLVEASLKAVRRAAPFPPFPKTMKMQQAVFQVPVAYRLR